MGCTTSKSIDISPPEPKNSVDTTINTEGENSIPDKSTNIDNVIIDNVIIDKKNKITWIERRNSYREKESITKYFDRVAHIELEKRLIYRSIVFAKCPSCGEDGPDSCNKYCGYWLVVPEIQTKNKCRKCDIAFNYEHFGLVKNISDMIDMIAEELAE